MIPLSNQLEFSIVLCGAILAPLTMVSPVGAQASACQAKAIPTFRGSKVGHAKQYVAMKP